MRIGLLAVFIMLGAWLSGCASTAGTSPSDHTSPRTAANASIPEAPLPASWKADGPSDTTDIVIAASQNGVNASWTSITESPLVRSTAELSNLGGAPVVLGTVGAMLVADAKPKGRAKRTAEAINADIDPAAMDRDFAAQLDAALGDDPTDIRITPITRARDLPDDAWIVNTTYTLAKDGTALKVSAHVAHSDDYRRALEIREEQRRRQFDDPRSTRYAFGDRSRYRTRRGARRYVPKYSGRFVYHSDPVTLPDPGDLPEPELQADVAKALRSALDAEREARILAAEANYAASIERALSDRKRKKAERRRAKALAKADALHAKGLEKAEDGKLDKMERLVLGIEAWRANEASALSDAIDSAHIFLAEALVQGLSGDTPSPPDDLSVSPGLLAGVDGVTLLDADEDGRMVLKAAGGQILSLPADGSMAEYGASVASP